MTTLQTTRRSPLKDARLLHKIGKRLGMPGAGLPRIIATLQTMRAAADKAATRDQLAPAVVSSQVPLRADMSLDELLHLVDGLQPVARSIAAWHKPQPIALTEQMQALGGSSR